MTDETICGTCGKKIPDGQVKIAEIKGCCSVTRVALCEGCWESYDSKRKTIEGNGES